MDVLCYDDLDEFGRDIDDPLAELEQDVVHAVFESFGSNPDDPARSLAIRDALSGPKDSGLRHFIETKLAQESRIAAVEARISVVSGLDLAQRLRIDLRLQVNEQEVSMAIDVDPNGTVRRATA